MKKAIIPLIGLLTILIAIISGIVYYRFISRSPSDSPTGDYSLEVKQGDVLTTISQKLYEDNVIRSPYSLRLKAVQTPVSELQIGVYSLTLPANAEELINQLNSQSKEKQQYNIDANLVPTKKVTIREGLTLDEVIDELASQGIAEKQDLIAFANSPETFRLKYAFLPTPLTCTYGELDSCAKYYLEGYVYPDTYTFVVGDSAQNVYDQMLSNFNNKVYSNLNESYSSDRLYQTLTIASVIERETGRTIGVTDSTANELAQERSIMSGVFANRAALGIKWQSDPTVTYGTGLTVCQQTFEIDGCVFLDDPRVNTLYNTYIIDGAPIGPTTSPQWSVIQAVINPTPSDYLFFVSDATGKKYFAQTEQEHLSNIEFVTELNDKLGL